MAWAECVRVKPVAWAMLTTVARVNTGARSGVRLGLELCQAMSSAIAGMPMAHSFSQY